ncbi:MAG: DUF4276 family protein [Candidatus Scalindua sp. AMX11]|nr:MAG: DUF4276 family protein [Candidatus Scalindua sp.]NOG84488.1 DUF4276 family protein [Planctomycetota bacterium]RZV80503.1 MAG: DUF4276 family protein [Candidatus Scalindua sp. SCAELEC01]TDE65317.1 MAG: DUF4276 family protein [Candidatus Scalindua sp. AMX11]
MKKVLVLVEGQTEEAFVKRVLHEHLLKYNVSLIPTIVSTKRVKSGPDFKGGIVSYKRVRGDILRLLHDSSAVLVTTMFDLYGLPNDFPGRSEARGAPQKKVRYIEEAFRKDIDNSRFLGYLSLHEFEGLLFSSPHIIAITLNAQDREIEINRIRESFSSPEEINDNPETAPSKRLLDIFPRYNKVFYGSTIAHRIGIKTIRSKCQHFHEWMTALENLGQKNQVLN